MQNCDPDPIDPTPTLYVWAGETRAPKEGEFFRPSPSFPVMQARWDHTRPAQIMLPVATLHPVEEAGDGTLSS